MCVCGSRMHFLTCVQMESAVPGVCVCMCVCVCIICVYFQCTTPHCISCCIHTSTYTLSSHTHTLPSTHTRYLHNTTHAKPHTRTAHIKLHTLTQLTSNQRRSGPCAGVDPRACAWTHCTTATMHTHTHVYSRYSRYDTLTPTTYTHTRHALYCTHRDGVSEVTAGRSTHHACVWH
jgi:hypothetical protein